ncbi:PREDICTED: uncharacterized protein LOC108370410 [Rhagoletis zephyria]|uniref:uncharacterized protein LOC108370410 n=1 Tax=Rhagoletis zephyria TaxID=28612 RepID=UPI0008113541|nr:PREDICTED: uncharacterized protein LOC108370410 [Rhagoletis zephyria]
MKEYVEKKLVEWELVSLIDVFKEEGFDEEAFKSLDYNGICNLIPRQGLRAKFWKKFNDEFLSETPVTANEIPIEVNSYVTDTSISGTNSILIYSPEPQPEKTVPSYLNCTDGKLLEVFYKANGNLDNFHRSTSARVIIYKEFEALNYPKKFKISTDRFMKLTSEIVEYFPSEKNFSSLYYTPYQSKIKRNATGKLWDIYNHLKSKLCKPQNPTVATFDEVDIEHNECVEFLKTNVTPWFKILDYWRKTHEERNKLLATQNSVFQYFEYFPVLQTTKGAELLIVDFDTNHPLSADKISSLWPEIERKLCKYAKNKKSKDLSDILNGSCQFKGFLILCHCLTNSTYTKCEGTKKKRKLTKQEVTGCFLALHEDGNLVLEKVKQLKNDAAQRKATLQPSIILIGTSYENITAAYVVVNETLFLFETALLAIDACFKITQSLNCAYADACKPIWTFIQKYVYEICTEYDQIVTSHYFSGTYNFI